MSFLMFLKVFSDVCLCFSALSAFPMLFGGDLPLFSVAILCGAGVGLAAVLDEHCKQMYWRFVGLVPTLAAVLFVGSVTDALVLAVPLVYVLLVIVKGEFSLEYFSYRHFLTRSLVIWCVFFAVIAAGYKFESTTGKPVEFFAVGRPFLFGLIYALVAVVLLRRLRLGISAHARSKALNRRQTAVFVGGASVLVAGAIALERVVAANSIALKELLGQVLSGILTFPIFLVGWIVDLAPSFRSENRGPAVTTATGTSDVTPSQPLVGDGGMAEVSTEVAESTFPWWLAALILALMLAAVVAMVLVYRARKSGSTSVEFIEKLRPQAKKSRDGRNNRTKLRAIYREFLKQEKKRGLKRRCDQTSLDILRSVSAETNTVAAEKLRELYLVARYAPDGRVNDAQVAEARRLLRECAKAEKTIS
ncbi:MAG: hypothetical protein IKU55_03045 [Clostridia bacterium]|nr:hypothetical protein [Clostridia bacterium]